VAPIRAATAPPSATDARRAGTGNLTILGSVANLIVVEEARAAGMEIGFVEYVRVGVPVTTLTLLVGWFVLILVPV
jgi:Na+/H+ antiporter NhaD/arsenite permease-like protein